MKFNKTLFVFLSLHFILWSVLPILFRANLPMDSAEALIWGFIGEWGTNKHPPLSGWLADVIYQITKTPYALYVLSQLFIVGAFLYIYKLAKLFLAQEKALIAALVMEGVAYYNFTSTEYNVNVISMMLWPAATYYFYRGIKGNKCYDWLMFGIFAGLNILNKYVSGILFVGLGAYLLFTGEGRTALKSWKLYGAAIVALAVVAPHIWWLYQRDWFVIDYFLSRSGGKALSYGLGHIVYPLKFLCAQILAAALALIILSVARIKSPEQVQKQDKAFVFYAGILPVLLMTALSAVAGIKLKSMWGTPTLYMLGIAFLIWFPVNVKQCQKQMITACYGALIVFVLAFVGQNLGTTSAKFKLNATDFVKAVDVENFDYVGGSVWLASTAGVYSLNHPQVLYLMNETQNPWIDMEDVRKKGILVVEEELSSYRLYQQQFKNLSEPKIYDLIVTTPFGKQKHYSLYYGTIAGE